MSRIEENSKLNFKPTGAMKTVDLELAKIKFLEDISRSLAFIADGDNSSAANDYVRDYLLIQWIFKEYHVNENVENTYKEWQAYLKEETQDGQRSQI